MPPSIALSFEDVRDAGRCPWCRRSKATRRPGYVLGTVTVDPPTVEVIGAEERGCARHGSGDRTGVGCGGPRDRR